MIASRLARLRALTLAAPLLLVAVLAYPAAALANDDAEAVAELHKRMMRAWGEGEILVARESAIEILALVEDETRASREDPFRDAHSVLESTKRQPDWRPDYDRPEYQFPESGGAVSADAPLRFVDLSGAALDIYGDETYPWPQGVRSEEARLRREAGLTTATYSGDRRGGNLAICTFPSASELSAGGASRLFRVGATEFARAEAILGAARDLDDEATRASRGLATYLDWLQMQDYEDRWHTARRENFAETVYLVSEYQRDRAWQDIRIVPASEKLPLRLLISVRDDQGSKYLEAAEVGERLPGYPGLEFAGERDGFALLRAADYRRPNLFATTAVQTHGWEAGAQQREREARLVAESPGTPEPIESPSWRPEIEYSIGTVITHPDGVRIEIDGESYGRGDVVHGWGMEILELSMDEVLFGWTDARNERGRRRIDLHTRTVVEMQTSSPPETTAPADAADVTVAVPLGSEPPTEESGDDAPPEVPPPTIVEFPETKAIIHGDDGFLVLVGADLLRVGDTVPRYDVVVEDISEDEVVFRIRGEARDTLRTVSLVPDR